MDPLSRLFFDGTAEQLPPVVSSLFWTVQKVHLFWRYGFDAQRITESGSHTFSYFCGLTMDKMGFADGLTGLPIKWLAQLAFAMDTARRVHVQIKRVNYIYQKLTFTLSGKDPAIRVYIDDIPEKNKRWRPFTRLIFNRATDEQIEYAMLHAVASVDRVAHLSLQLLLEIFILSNLSLMYLESLSWSEVNKNYSVQMFFLNWQSVFAELSENKMLLRKQLEALTPLMRRLGIDAESLIKGCETTLDLAALIAALPETEFVKATDLALNYVAYAAHVSIRSVSTSFSWWRSKRIDPYYLPAYLPRPTFGAFDDTIPPEQDLWALSVPKKSYTVLPI